MTGGLLWQRLLRGLFNRGAHGAPGRAAFLPAACPHCTNLDTLTMHCPHDRCGWARCSCGALTSSTGWHRHPRHHSSRDTCHDPANAI
jgi:hypothetical protein